MYTRQENKISYCCGENARHKFSCKLSKAQFTLRQKIEFGARKEFENFVLNNFLFLPPWLHQRHSKVFV